MQRKMGTLTLSCLEMHADWKHEKDLDKNKCTETMQKLFKHDFNIHEMDKYCEELLIPH